jgi:short subunit dehydrogenase-like uncharacterized protein
MSLVIYGANGYTGRLVAREALARGHRPILAGRNRTALAALAAELGAPVRAAALDDAAALDSVLAGARAVLHCAGPFEDTWRPMADACLRNGVHYLDVTGEIAVLEALAARDVEARRAGIVLLPGAGFDVVPTDCLALHLKQRLPAATALVLAFRTRGGMSRGTLRTSLRKLGRPGAVRRGGRIIPVPIAWKTREVDFGHGPRPAVIIPWGDVATAWHTTGIPDIEVYIAVPRRTILLLRGTRWLSPLLGLAPVRAVASGLARLRPPGPSDETRRQGGVVVWGEVTDPDGRRAAALLTGPEGYTFTAMAMVRAAERLLGGGLAAGFHTPARAFGADFVLEIPGVARTDLPTPLP